ncbi:hypothetical protein BT96DRAFT_470768 [Gymnopus androsaceus JB14]|uniref:Uncharacterized protein n=1 Tax=Gymnopus androsaceus JB14 TaxID=1447944 RepID=A0A6A4II39_9AGAR|nr:hypothetical protein BT96DRAFT_470768 [Gymnopus androsaceus JB14]
MRMKMAFIDKVSLRQHQQPEETKKGEEEEEDLYANEINWDAKMTQNPSQLPTTQTESQSSTPARNYGSIVKRRPTSQPPGAQNSSSPATSRPPSFEVQNTPRRQAWYAPRRKRSRGEGLSPSSSPALSPALSPMETAFGLGPLHKPRFPSSRLNEDPSQSSLHRKRYKLDSSVDSESQAQPQRRIRRSGLPVSRDLERDDECEADVSQMQVETQLTMSSPPPRIQRRYSHYPSKSNNPLEYALQSQAPYDSQE